MLNHCLLQYIVYIKISGKNHIRFFCLNFYILEEYEDKFAPKREYSTNEFYRKEGSKELISEHFKLLSSQLYVPVALPPVK
jgi:hypothetical protein